MIKEYQLNQNKILKIDGDDSVLTSLYKRASLFVFPSKYEGFGLPLLEAASNNCPIACSRIDVFKEIMKENVSYFDPYIVEEIIHSIENILFSDTLKKKFVNDAKSILSNFSWSKCADQTLKVYKTL